LQKTTFPAQIQLLRELFWRKCSNCKDFLGEYCKINNN